ncbi:CIR protein [Plasmodium chabaudi adami]|uniref:CIR protein n=1 Tax=Plasmodium chabaudi adami TaxID=5826 RepID=A0A1C6WHA8_PLACE|nr:CIR protein [Plasmodium chabaudi adami]
MSAHVCRIFQSLYDQLPDEDDEPKKTNDTVLLYETFCPINEYGYQKCNSDLDKISAGFGYLLPQLFGNVDHEEEHEDQKGNYVYYGLLWISYKLQQLNKNNDKSSVLYDFFNSHIVKGDWYEEYKEEIENKTHLINKEVDIDLMSDVYYIFKQMCKTLSNDEDDFSNLEDFSMYYNSVKICAEKLKKCSKDGSTDPSSNQYLAIYDMLQSVYNDFRKDYFKNNSECDNVPDLPDFKEIEVTPEPDLPKSDSQENTNEPPETQDNVDNKQANPESELEQPKNNEAVKELWDVEIEGEICLENLKPELPDFEIKLAKFETELPDFEIELAKFETELPKFSDPLEVSDIEVDAEIILDELGVSNMEVEYSDVHDDFFYIDTYFSKLEDELSFSEDKYSSMKPHNIDFIFPDLDNEQTDLDIEQNDSDNQSQPHQTNTLKFDDPFKNPENFSDSIMCKLYGPKSVYCNRIICNRIKIGVIALSIPIVLVFVYKYFIWKRTKKPKKTKKMKRIINLLDRKKTKKIDINSIDDKKAMQTIINSNDKKKTTKRIINFNDKKKTTKRIINFNGKKKTIKRNIRSDNGKASLLFNIYKQMRLSPMPFIHLFMLLIFFIFKRKKDSIE